MARNTLFSVSNPIPSSLRRQNLLILLFWYWRPLLRFLPRDFHFLLFRSALLEWHVEIGCHGVRSGPGAARTILLFHIISARPSKQPLMVHTFLEVYMELGSSFLFLQEQIKDIIIGGRKRGVV